MIALQEKVSSYVARVVTKGAQAVWNCTEDQAREGLEARRIFREYKKETGRMSYSEAQQRADQLGMYGSLRFEHWAMQDAYLPFTTQRIQTFPQFSDWLRSLPRERRLQAKQTRISF
jgi:hypothetical protein